MRAIFPLDKLRNVLYNKEVRSDGPDNLKRKGVNAMVTLVVVAALFLAFTLGFGAGVVVVNRVRRTQIVARDVRIAELESQIRERSPSRNGRHP